MIKTEITHHRREELISHAMLVHNLKYIPRVTITRLDGFNHPNSIYAFHPYNGVGHTPVMKNVSTFLEDDTVTWTLYHLYKEDSGNLSIRIFI